MGLVVPDCTRCCGQGSSDVLLLCPRRTGVARAICRENPRRARSFSRLCRETRAAIASAAPGMSRNEAPYRLQDPRVRGREPVGCESRSWRSCSAAMSVVLGRSPIRRAVLERIVEDPGVGVSARSLAKDLGVHHGWLSLQLKVLESEGVLTSRPGQRQRILYFLHQESDTARAVSALVGARTGIEERLRSALLGLAGVEEVVLLPDEGGQGGDLEILVVGEVEPEELGKRLLGIRKKAGRGVSPLVLSREDLEHRLQMRRLYESGKVVWRRRQTRTKDRHPAPG